MVAKQPREISGCKQPHIHEFTSHDSIILVSQWSFITHFIIYNFTCTHIIKVLETFVSCTVAALSCIFNKNSKTFSWMCMYVSVKSIIMVTRLDVVFPYVKHVAISCVLLIYGYVMFGVSHGGQRNQQIKAWTHTHTQWLCSEQWLDMCMSVSVCDSMLKVRKCRVSVIFLVELHTFVKVSLNSWVEETTHRAQKYVFSKIFIQNIF